VYVSVQQVSNSSQVVFFEQQLPKGYIVVDSALRVNSHCSYKVSINQPYIILFSVQMIFPNTGYNRSMGKLLVKH